MVLPQGLRGIPVPHPPTNKFQSIETLNNVGIGCTELLDLKKLCNGAENQTSCQGQVAFKFQKPGDPNLFLFHFLLS